MGRPLNKRYFGDPAGAGFQITVTAHIPGESDPAAGFILRQRSNLKYLVEAGGEVGVCKLVNKSAPDEGEMIVEVTSAVTFGTLAEDDDEDEFDGSTDQGTFTGGTGYEAGDLITLSNGAVVEVDAVDDQADDTVTEFSITETIGDPVSEGTVLTQVSTDGGGEGFTLTPGSDNLDVVAELARIINNRVVKTWQGNTYAWPTTGAPRSRPERDIEGS